MKVITKPLEMCDIYAKKRCSSGKKFTLHGTDIYEGRTQSLRRNMDATIHSPLI